jgi:AcrR family transcriptional regulator
VLVKSSHRQRQAQATRSEIARSARRLFAADGYVATTIEAISDAARIPVPTIYSAFGNKPSILEEIRTLWIAESDVEDLHRRAMLVPDPVQRLRRAAHWTRRQMELGYDVIAVYTEAARADARVEKVWRKALYRREVAVRQILDSIGRNLRPGLSLAQALDIYVTCTLPEAYRTLVIERGWSLDRYEAWLGDLLTSQIISAAALAQSDRSRRLDREPA